MAFARRLILLALLIAAHTAAAQTLTVDSKDVQIARKKLQIGTDTARNFISIVSVIVNSATQRQAPTAKAVYDAIQAIAAQAAASGLANAAKIRLNNTNTTGIDLQGTDGLRFSQVSGTLIQGSLRDTSISLSKINRSGALDNNSIRWNGTNWVASARNLYDIVSANYTVSASLNEVFVDGQTANITLNLPPCNTANNGAKFAITKSGGDNFSIGIDPSGSETFQDGTAIKRLYSRGTTISCTCTFVSGTGKWHFNNM
jgi:hypothetical protein